MTAVLDPDEFRIALGTLEGWSGTPEEGLVKRFRRDGFLGAIDFVNRVAEVAESVNHHPDIAVRWNTVELVIASHSLGGVTAACVDLARRIDAVAGSPAGDT